VIVRVRIKVIVRVGVRVIVGTIFIVSVRIRIIV
jgi:hypothetical protein